LGSSPTTKRGERNYQKALKAGATPLGKVKGVSRKEAVAAAKKHQEAL
jgi:hypothetical protein